MRFDLFTKFVNKEFPNSAKNMADHWSYGTRIQGMPSDEIGTSEMTDLGYGLGKELQKLDTHEDYSNAVREKVTSFLNQNKIPQNLLQTFIDNFNRGLTPTRKFKA